MIKIEKNQGDYVYEHRNHIVNISYQRVGFFMVFESVLLGVFGVLYSKSNPPTPLLLVIAILGFILTTFWCYAQIRLEIILEDLTEWTKELVPEYKAIMERRPKEVLPFLSWRILNAGVPCLVLLIWITLILFTVFL